MATKKRYRIYCLSEMTNVIGYTYLDIPPAECPNNASHQVRVPSLSVEEEYHLDNLTADRAPSSTDDISQGYAVGSKWLFGTQVWFCSDNALNMAVWVRETTGVFGTERTSSASLGQSTTTAQDSFQTKLTLEVTVPEGEYRLGWSYELAATAANKKTRSQVVLDGETVLTAPDVYVGSAYAYGACGGFANVPLSAGSHTFVLSYCTGASSATAVIRNARFEFWRIG